MVKVGMTAGECRILEAMEGIVSARTKGEMRDVLLEPDSAAPETFYYMLRGGPEKGNITIWEPGRAGREYIKTLGHYHTSDFAEVYHVLSGEGIALLQKRGASEGELEDVRVLRVKVGDTLELMPGYGHALANIGAGFLITTDNSPSSDPAHPHADYEPIRKMGGMAYFVVEHEGLPALVRNSNYTSIAKEDLGGLPVIG